MFFVFSTYEGDVVNGVRHGAGVLHAVSIGITYSGDWIMGKQHGKVTVFNVLSLILMLRTSASEFYDIAYSETHSH